MSAFIERVSKPTPSLSCRKEKDDDSAAKASAPSTVQDNQHCDLAKRSW